MKSPGNEFFTYPIQKFTFFFFGVMTTFKFASLKGICTAGQSHAGQLYICIYIERRGVSSIGKIISHTLLSTRRDTKETNGVKKTETNKRKIDCLVIFVFIFIYFFDGLPRVPYEFLFPELEPTLGMSVLLLGRGKVNDSPTPSRGFQIGDPSGLAAAGV